MPLVIEVRADPVAEEAEMHLFMAIGVGVVLGLCAMVFLYLLRKNRKRAKQLFISFLGTHCN